MTEEYPEEMTGEQMKRAYPEVKPGAVMVVLGERIYQRSGDRWYLLSNRVGNGAGA